MRAVPHLIVALALVAGPMRADSQPAPDPSPLEQGQQLEANLEYERALVLADRTIATGGLERSDLAALHMLAGRVAAGLDKPDIAERHFAIALALQPEVATLPEGTSPKLTQPFEAAQARTVLLDINPRGTARGVFVDAIDALALVASVRVRVAGGSDVVRPVEHVAGVVRIEIELPAGATVLAADVLDEHGNILAHAESAELRPPERAAPRPVYARWSTWAIASGVALAGAGVCAWRFGVAQDEWNRLSSAGGHDYSELVAIEDRGRAWGIAADVGFGLAAASVIVTVVVFATHRESPPIQLAVTPTTLGLTARF